MPRHDQASAATLCPAPLDLAPPAVALLGQPLDYIMADHLRQRCLCAALRVLAVERRASRSDADRIVAYLTGDLAEHHRDEDELLYPTLRRRARAEDELGVILARLGEDHRQAEALAEAIAAALAARPADDPVAIDAATGELLLAFATREHRHLAIENAIVMVIARRRLTSTDLAAMSRAMKARRGIAS